MLLGAESDLLAPRGWTHALVAIMIAVLFTFVLLLHAFALRAFWRPLRTRHYPSTAAFAVLSVILFYDLGIGLELLGYPYQSPYFSSLLDADQFTALLALSLIGAAPWLFLSGAFVIAHGDKHIPFGIDFPALRPKRKALFFALGIGSGLILSIYSVYRVMQGQALWVIREDVGSLFGPAVLIFYLPLYFLASFSWQAESRGRRGAALTTFFALCACVAPLILAERTLLLLPIVIALVFRFRISTARLLAVTAVAVFCAALLLPIYKWQYATTDARPDQLVAATVSDDLARGGVLRKALELSAPLGTNIMPYPMAGYVYTALLAVPRGLAPYKGSATAQYFTGSIVGAAPEQTSWGFGVGVIEEVATNAGVVALLPGLFIYGMLMGWLDRLSSRRPVLVVPTRLGAAFLCGYNLSALLLLFGSMALVVLVLHAVFTIQRATDKTTSHSGSHTLVPSPKPEAVV